MRTSVAWKLNIVFCLIVGILTVFISYLAYQTFASHIFKEIENRLSISVTYTMQMIDRTLFERVSDIELLTSQNNKALVNDEQMDSENIKDEIVYLRDVEKLRKVYASMSVYDTKGIKLGDTRGLLIGVDESQKPFFQSAILGNVYWDKKPVMSQSLGFPVVHFSGPLKDIQGNIKGVLVARFPVGKLHDIMRKTIGQETLENINIDLLDQSGLILFSNHDRADILSEKFRGFEMIQNILNAKKTEIVKFTRRDEGHERLFLVTQQKGYLDFEGNHWILVVSIKSDLLFRSVHSLIKAFSFIGLLFIAMMIPLGLFLSRIVSKPLVRLTRVIEEIGKGNLNKKIDIQTNDEIGELADSFNTMTAKLRESYETLEEKVKQRTMELQESLEQKKKAEENLKNNLEELEKFLAITVDRENVMIELKKEVNQLAVALKKEPPYDMSFLEGNNQPFETEKEG